MTGDSAPRRGGAFTPGSEPTKTPEYAAADFNISIPFNSSTPIRGRAPPAASSERQRIRTWNDPDLAIEWKFLTSLVWAPAFPLIRHSLRSFPQMRTRIMFGCIVVANMHGFWLINNPDLSDEALGVKR